MARSLITEVTDDLQSDSGAVLFSFVQGEQLEFPITLSFINNVGLAYEYEAVIIEGLNNGSGEMPSATRPGGIQTVLSVYRPPWKSTWVAATTYYGDDVVIYNGAYYISLATAVGYVSAVTPNLDLSHWTPYTPNKIYVQFPSTLTSNWLGTVVTSPSANLYGFFELRVTEPVGPRYRRTWKPVRGLVEFLYSPTALVADI